ncbi:SLC35E2B [Symbiodinium sp. KB8]|nr:SLC35E2B [Symbiodinium sp. KB8]
MVQAVCPESCRSCSNASLQGTSRSGSRGHATVAAAELARMTASVPATARCSIERQIAYQDQSRYFFRWRAVLSAETCASLCASSPECLAFTFYVTDQSEFSKFDCVLHNSTSASTHGRRADPCCHSGQACAARCTNQDLYVSLLTQTSGLSYITNCEEYLVSLFFAQNASSCQSLPDPGLTEGLCALSCFARVPIMGSGDAYPTLPPSTTTETPLRSSSQVQGLIQGSPTTTQSSSTPMAATPRPGVVQTAVGSTTLSIPHFRALFCLLISRAFAHW